MNVKQVYKILLEDIKSNNYTLDVTTCNMIKNLPVEYSNFLLGLIYEFYVIEQKKNHVILTDLVKKTNTKGNTLIIPYKAKTHDNGKGPQFNNANRLPLELQKLIVAYINYITK